ncbi:hypothetical protein PCE1_002032 [Barthelona sp. PCE]
MEDENLDLGTFSILYSAESGQELTHVFFESFRDPESIEVHEYIVEHLGTDILKAQDLAKAVCAFFSFVLSENLRSKRKIASLLPEDLPEDLVVGIVEFTVKYYAALQSISIDKEVRLPKLVSFDYQLRWWTATENIEGISQPSALCFLETEKDKISFELTQDSLNVLLSGMRKISDQVQGLSQE